MMADASYRFDSRVMVGGRGVCSVRFVELKPDLQRDLINRTFYA